MIEVLSGKLKNHNILVSHVMTTMRKMRDELLVHGYLREEAKNVDIDIPIIKPNKSPKPMTKYDNPYANIHSDGDRKSDK